MSLCSKCSRYIYISIHTHIYIIPCIYPISVKVLFRLWHSEEDDKTRMMGIAGHCGDASCIGGLWVLGEEANKTNGNKTYRVESENGSCQTHPEAWYEAFKAWISFKGANRRAALFLCSDADAGWHIWLVERVGSKFAFYPDATLHV